MGGYIGARAGSLSTTTVANVQDVTATDTTPEVTIINNTHEDTDGGREGKVIFKGQQSGGEESTLAEIQGSHDGTADDEKGDLIFRTNDGSDGASPTERVRIDSNGSILTATLGTDNVHLGEGAGASITSGGTQNVLIGKDAGTAITIGDNNVAIGYEALKTEDGHGNNVAVGYQSLKTQNAGANAGNTSVGYASGLDLTTGHSTTLVGALSGTNLTTGNESTAVGYNALASETTGGRNTALGFNSLTALNRTSDGYNTAIGWDAGKSLTTGAENTIIGGEAADALSVGNDNVAIGNQALSTDINGSRNVAIGATALKVQESPGSTSNNMYNIAIGFGAMIASTTGHSNTVIGSNAMNAATDSSYNTVVGISAANDMTTNSSANTCIGGFAGDGMTASAVNNTYLGYNTQTNAAGDDYQIVIGTDMNGVGAEYFTFGNNSRGRVYNQFSANASWTRTSDERIKKDIQTNTDLGLDFINDLRTVTYKWKAPSEHPEEFVSYDADKTEAAYTNKMYGFIAQEVKQALDDHNITDFAGWHVTEESQGSQQGVSYEMFVMPLVKAVQELSAKVTTLETKVAALEAE